MLQRPPGLLIHLRGKRYPCWYPLKPPVSPEMIRETIITHLTFHGKEAQSGHNLDGPTFMSSHYAEGLGLPLDTPAAKVIEALTAKGHTEEAGTVRRHNYDQERLIAPDEFSVLFVRRFQMVKDRKDPGVAEALDADVIDIRKYLG